MLLSLGNLTFHHFSISTDNNEGMRKGLLDPKIITLSDLNPTSQLDTRLCGLLDS